LGIRRKRNIQSIERENKVKAALKILLISACSILGFFLTVWITNRMNTQSHKPKNRPLIERAVDALEDIAESEKQERKERQERKK
jgi:uncharacterized protein YneF (UPF0154 family)